MMDVSKLPAAVETPAIVAVIDHKTGHSAVDADILTGDETSLVGTEVEDHIRNVHRIADTTGRLLHGIRTFLDCVSSIYPTGRNRVDAHLPGQAHGKSVSQRSDATFGRGVTLGLRLAHPVSG